MLFRRRNPITFLKRVQVALWPSSSYRRSLVYFGKRILRYSASPHAVSAGVAAGVFASFTPFLGFHLLIAILIAMMIRGNSIVAGISTLFGNPLTFPLIWAISLQVGFLLTSSNASIPSERPMDLVDSEAVSPTYQIWSGFWDFWANLSSEIGWPLLIGSLPCGLISGIIVYVVMFYLVTVYQKSRLSRLKLRKIRPLRRNMRNEKQD